MPVSKGLKYIFTRPIQSISHKLSATMLWKVVPYCVYFSLSLISHIYKSPGSKLSNEKNKYFLRQIYERWVVSDLKTLDQKWSKSRFLVFVNHPVVYSGEVSNWGSLSVSVGVSDSWQVTGDTQHATQVSCQTSNVTPDTLYRTTDM